VTAATANTPDGPALAPALAVQHLRTEFRIQGAWHPAVDDISFSIARRETLALVGESGCGKSITALSVMGLVPRPQGRIAAGRILLDGTDLTKLPEPALEKLRGASVAMIFQEPMTSLNPVMTVGAQVAEALTVHHGLSRRASDAKALAVLDEVKIPSAAARFHEYPHQFSGGMRQRVMIAMALSCNPQLLIADEPTTALDVTIQAQILDLLGEMKARLGMAIMLITHAMGVVAETAQRVVVMYAGRVVEEASVEALFARPLHPYTQGLIRSIPRIDKVAGKKLRLEAIGGMVPSLIDPPPGCRFAPRCKRAMPACTDAVPELRAVEAGHKVACILY
jgi:peptide/nickel transport system ATP-binding protein